MIRSSSALFALENPENGPPRGRRQEGEADGALGVARPSQDGGDGHAKPKQQDLAPPTDADDVCAIYGAGYHRVPGTDTRIKVGGYISAEAGVSGGASKSGNSSH